MTISFPDKEVTYDRFVSDVAHRIASILKSDSKMPELVSQREAWRLFGRANVERWRKSGKIEPIKRPGKLDYSTAELRNLLINQQDYTIPHK